MVCAISSQPLDVLQALVSCIEESAHYPSQCLWIHRWLWISWGLIPTIRWLYYFLASYCSDSWEKAKPVIRKVFLYPQAPKASRWSVTSSICRSTSHGSFTKNGVRLTVSFPMIEWPLVENSHFIAGRFRWYRILQRPWPALFGFGLSAKNQWPLREKIFKLLG